MADVTAYDSDIGGADVDDVAMGNASPANIEAFRTVTLTLDWANQYVSPGEVETSINDCWGRVLDLEITNQGDEADLAGALVWLVWRHRSVGNRGVRLLKPVDGSPGRFRGFFPVNMAHLGDAKCYVAITNDKHTFYLASKDFVVKLNGIVVEGREQDTCDDFSDLQYAMGQCKTFLARLVDSLAEQRRIFDAQQADFDRRYNEREDIRDGWYREREYERDDMYKDAEAHRDWEFDNYRDLTIAALGGAAAAHLQRQINWLSRTLSDVDFVRAVTESRDGDDVVVPDVEDFLTDAEFGELLGEGDAHA